MRIQIYVRLTEYGEENQPPPFYTETSTVSWRRLKYLLCDLYGDGLVQDVEMWYWDEEDLVTVSSQEELDEAFRLAEEGGRSVLQLHVQKVVKRATRSSYQQPAADSSRGTAAVYHVRGQQFQERKGTGVERPECSMWESSQLSQLPKAEKPRSIFDNPPKQPNSLADGLDLQEKAQGKRVSRSTGKAASSLSAKVRAQIMGPEFYTTMRKMFSANPDEGLTLELSDEDESADLGHSMMPGALSGANAIAIEMPEMEHQGTESAEPAEIAETGEVTTMSSRDAETGFWMQPLLEAEVKAELRRKLISLVEKHQASSDRLEQKKHECKASRTDSAHKKKKHHGGESVSEDSAHKKKKYHGEESVSEDSAHKKKKRHGGESVSGKSVRDFVMKEKSSSSSPLDVVSEEASSSAPRPHKKDERKPSKSEGKKKKYSTEPLTQEAFMRYMMKFEEQMKKDIAKAVARKTVRSVIKNLPKQGEGSETPASMPVIPTQKTGYVHEGIICDYCDHEIVGTRYICGNCPNYDLCEECESIQPSFHDWSHVFIKLRRPCRKAGTLYGMRLPLLERVIYEAKDEERKEDGERIQVIKECAEGPESLAERCHSRNNNSEEGEEGDLSEPPSQDEQEEEYQMLENSERMYDVKASEVDDSEAETTVSIDQTMENAKPQFRTLSTVTENMMSVTECELLAFEDNPTAFYPTDLLRHIIAVRPIPKLFTIYGHPGVYQFERRTCEGRAPYESEVQYFFKTREIADADCQPTVFHATELMVHIISQKLFPPAFVVKGIPDLYVPYYAAVPDASKVPVPDVWIDEQANDEQPLELKSEPAVDEEDDHVGPELDMYPDCVEDGFVMYSHTQGCSEEQVTGERSTSPASSIEVVKLTHSDVCLEPVTRSLETMIVKDETGVRMHQCAPCQADDARSLSSFTDESSSDEDFVVIVPDCFDTSKPLDPVSLQRLSHEELNKGSTLENKLDKDQSEGEAVVRGNHELAYPEFLKRKSEARIDEEKVERSCAPCMASGEKTVQASFPPTEEEMSDMEGCPRCRDPRFPDHNPIDHTLVVVDGVIYDWASWKQKVKMEGKRAAVCEEAEEQEENSCARQDLPSVTEAGSNQLEACAAVDHTPEPSKEVKVSQSQSHSFRSGTQDPKDPDISDIRQTDLKCSEEIPESLDPEQQLNDIVTNTFKKASSGLQQLYRTGKDIFKTLQRGDSYETEECTVFTPADYRLPESTWRPSNKEFVMPKSNFKLVEKEFHMPKTTYSGPQTQAPSAGVYSGEFSGPLQRIREMGYFNNERILALLRKYEGDVEKVVNELVEEMDSDWADRRHGNSA